MLLEFYGMVQYRYNSANTKYSTGSGICASLRPIELKRMEHAYWLQAMYIS